jgi:hypothetical protein
MIVNPEKLGDGTHKKYHAVSRDGLAGIGEKLNGGDVWANKLTPKISDP